MTSELVGDYVLEVLYKDKSGERRAWKKSIQIN
jgi:hypothetical protein